jgi:hypothetical protein
MLTKKIESIGIISSIKQLNYEIIKAINKIFDVDNINLIDNEEFDSKHFYHNNLILVQDSKLALYSTNLIQSHFQNPSQLIVVFNFENDPDKTLSENIKILGSIQMNYNNYSLQEFFSNLKLSVHESRILQIQKTADLEP